MAITKETAPFTYTGTWDITEYAPNAYYARFLSNGIFTPKTDITMDLFFMSGGQSGAESPIWGKGGVGGAGGSYNDLYGQTFTAGISISVVIGAGGSASGGGLNYGTASTFGALSPALLPGMAGGAKDKQGTNGVMPFNGDISPFNSMRYGGGGGGGGTQDQNGGAGGEGGGGKGGPSGYKGQSGTPNTGGGGGGSGFSGSTYKYGGDGGTGIIIIRNILKSPVPTVQVNDNGIIRTLSKIQVNDNGIIRDISKILINDRGILRTLRQ